MSENIQKKSNTKVVFFIFIFFTFFLCVVSLLGVGIVSYTLRDSGSNFFSNNFSFNPNQPQDKKSENLSKKAKEIIDNISADEAFVGTGVIVDLAERLSPAVTTVVVKSQAFSFDTFTVEEQSQGSGTGFFVSNTGLLVTNQHVVCGVSNPSDIVVITNEGKEYGVKRFDTDPFQDIAILEVDTKGDKIKYLEFANKESRLKIGQDVIAIGNPFGSNPNSVTRGIISGLNRNIQASGSCGSQFLGQQETKFYDGMLQTDAAINFGNSGGPLINLNGEVIGVNAATSTGANNISYAIPFERVVRLIERYVANDGNIVHPYLGVQQEMIDISNSKRLGIPVGAFIRAIVPDSPASKADLRIYDIISKVDDITVDFSLSATLNQHFNPGDEVTLEVYRIKDTKNTLDLNNNNRRIELVYPEEPIKIKVVLGERDI